MNAICPKHGIRITIDGDKFCDLCGAPLELVGMHTCGRALYPTDLYCPRCGESVTPIGSRRHA